MRIALPPISPDAFAGHDPRAAVIDLAGETMGTTWSVRYAAHFGAHDIRSAIEARLAGLVREMSHWDRTSVLSQFNRAEPGTWTILPPDFAQVIRRGLEIAALTSGAFDPAIGRLVDLWGFGPVPAPGTPDAAAVDAARARSGWTRLACTPDGRYLHQPGGVQFDLSGIAKGHAVDAVADLLRAHGVRHCLVEIGGELVGRGVRPDGEPWWVDLEVPPGLALARLRIGLHEIAVATSGDYRRGAHTLDPRTGRPITNSVVSASVVHRSALEADAWATALTVLGPDEGMALAARYDIAGRLVTVRGAAVDEHITPALAAMLAD